MALASKLNKAICLGARRAIRFRCPNINKAVTSDHLNTVGGPAGRTRKRRGYLRASSTARFIASSRRSLVSTLPLRSISITCGMLATSGGPKNGVHYTSNSRSVKCWRMFENWRDATSRLLKKSSCLFQQPASVG